MRLLMSKWSVIIAGLLGMGIAGGAMVASESGPTFQGLSGSPTIAAAALPDDDSVTAPKTAPTPPTTPKPKVDEAFVIKRILPIEGPIRYGEMHWDDAGVADGPIVITVDLDARVLSVFKGGYEIGATAVLLGTQEKPTPLGVFPITQKRAKHTSSIYGAPMPFMQRLTNDGISLHATTVERGYASHGCIGMPLEFSEKLFGVTKLGDKVYITRGKTVGMGDALVES